MFLSNSVLSYSYLTCVYMKEFAFLSKTLKPTHDIKFVLTSQVHHEIFLSFLIMLDCNKTTENQEIAASYIRGHRYTYLLHTNFCS